MATIPPADVFVVFGITGDLAKVMTFRSLYRLDDCPTGAPRRVAAQARHHFVAVEVRDGSPTVTSVASDDTLLDRAVIRR